VGSGYIEDKGLLMLRSGDRYYLAQIKENKVAGVEEQKIGWKTWEDTIREYPGLGDAEILSSQQSISEFVSFAVSSWGKEYLVTIDGDKVVDLDPVDLDGWIELAMRDEQVRKAFEGKEHNATWFLLPTYDGKNSIGIDIKTEEKNYSFTMNPDSGDVSLFLDMNEYFPEGYLEYIESVDPVEIAMEDPKVKEMINGRKYKFDSPFYFSSSVYTSGSKGVYTGLARDNKTENEVDEESVDIVSDGVSVKMMLGNRTTSAKNYEAQHFLCSSGCNIFLNIEGELYMVRVLLWADGPRKDVSIMDLEEEYLKYYEPVLKECLTEDAKVVGTLVASVGHEPAFFVYAEKNGKIYSISISDNVVRDVEQMEISGKQNLLERITERIREACP
jgi:hypothetical protein